MNAHMALIGLLLVGLAGSPVVAASSGQDGAKGEGGEEAMRLCHRAVDRRGDERARLLARGLRLAEAAVAADDGDARAHLAVFCNLGKQLDDAGLGFGSLGKLRRLRGEIDRAVELAPRDADVLAAKGAFLMELPPMFGGDRDQGEHFLRLSLAVDDDHPGAKRYLARALQARGAEPDEAGDAVGGGDAFARAE